MSPSVDQWQDAGGLSGMLKRFMDFVGEDLEWRWLCVWNSSRIPLLMCQNLIVLSLLVLIVSQVVEELVVEFPRFSNELSLRDSQHQSVHFFIEFSVLIKHQGCHTEHHSDGHTDCYCN